MPHQKHAKNNRHNANRADPNNNVHADQNTNGPAPARNDQRMQKCCMPTVCPVKEELIDTENVGDAVRVVCNNEACVVGNWMHKSCFDAFEESVLAYLRSCGRARSWSEKQRLQNLWTKKGYDLAFKACDCTCGKGHLRKDLDYIAPVVDNSAKKKGKKKATSSKPDLNTGNVVARERRSSGNNNSNANTIPTAKVNCSVLNGKIDNNILGDKNGNHSSPHHIRKTSPSITIINNCNDNRLRANSISSTGSSPPHSASSINSGSDSPVPQSPQNHSLIRHAVKAKFNYPEHLSTHEGSPLNGSVYSIFPKRSDLSAFSILPRHKQNPYHIKMEDDALSGNDDVHTFVLNHLSTYKISSLHCVLCKNELCVFDRYPLVDGTLFLSPQAYDNQVLQVISDGRLQYINAVCVTCLESGNEIRCASCKRRWDGSSLQLGSMYSYDIFAAMPCCQKRLTCKHCRRAVIDVASGLPYFSAYSHMIPCPYCKAYDYHFIRPLPETFAVKVTIWN
ncbi:hypothetical protein ACF0H5_008271 [Mactra antiquata]